MLITKRSPFSGVVHAREIDITGHHLWLWKEGGKLIQEAMPHISADDREFLMTGITPEEWTEYLGNDEGMGEQNEK